jgi:hypothetical protein
MASKKRRPETVEEIDKDQLASMKEPTKVLRAASICRVSRRTIQRWIKEGRVAKVCGRVDVAQVRGCVDELYNVPRRGPRPGAYQFPLKLGKTREPQKRLSEAERIEIIGQHIMKLESDWAFVRLADYVVARAKNAVTSAPAPSA